MNDHLQARLCDFTERNIAPTDSSVTILPNRYDEAKAGPRRQRTVRSGCIDSFEAMGRHSLLYQVG